MIGSLIRGRYELTGLLSESALFTTYSARDRVLGREIALRMVKPPVSTETAFYGALRNIISQSTSVLHPGVERLIDVEQHEGQSFITGDLTRAPSLGERMRKLAPFSAPVATSMAISLCQALDVLHKANIIHGEISGESVVLLADGAVKLQMAGLWEAYSASSTAGSAVLTAIAPYLAPEVTNGAMPSAQSDIYAVGILLYELLTGRRPYNAETPLATAMRHVSQATPAVRDANPSVPNVLNEIVKRAMAKDPEDRYTKAADLLSDLRLVQDALRFGKTLTWPLRNASGSLRAADPQPVAPRMSAIHPEEEPAERSRRARAERDVPIWMMMSMVFLCAVVASLLGFWFFLSMSRPRLVAVPNVRGLAVQEARDTLAKLKLQMRIGTRIANDKTEADKVLEIDPPAGIRLTENSMVTVTLSAGSSVVEVPELRGLTPDKARSVLGTVHLGLEEVIAKVDDPSVSVGSIVKQVPAARSRVSRDSKIKVTISSLDAPPATPDGAGRADQARPIPRGDASLTYEYSLTVTLTDLQDSVNVRVDMIDDDGTKTIFGGEKSPGETISLTAPGKGKQASFKIYYNDKLVKEFTQRAEGG